VVHQNRSWLYTAGAGGDAPVQELIINSWCKRWCTSPGAAILGGAEGGAPSQKLKSKWVLQAVQGEQLHQTSSRCSALCSGAQFL
jgi:hypothetical protein